MNKRQRKKNYKKQYGINPNEVMATIGEQLKDAIPKMIDAMKKCLDVIVKTANELPKKVQDMPEEEFQKLINSPEATGKQVLQLLAWRRKGD